MGLGFYRVHKCLLTFTILLVVTFLKITSSDVSIGMVAIFLIQPFDILYFLVCSFQGTISNVHSHSAVSFDSADASSQSRAFAL